MAGLLLLFFDPATCFKVLVGQSQHEHRKTFLGANGGPGVFDFPGGITLRNGLGSGKSSGASSLLMICT